MKININSLESNVKSIEEGIVTLKSYNSYKDYKRSVIELEDLNELINEFNENEYLY